MLKKKNKKEELKNIVNDQNKFNKIEKKYLFELAQKYNYLFNTEPNIHCKYKGE